MLTNNQRIGIAGILALTALVCAFGAILFVFAGNNNFWVLIGIGVLMLLIAKCLHPSQLQGS